MADPADYYYRRVSTATRCACWRWPRASTSTDADRVIVTGASQGGGITIAVAGLAGPVRRAAGRPRRPTYRSSVTSGARWRSPTTHPYVEMTEYLAGWRDHTETAYRTLSYFDGANLGR